MGLVDRMIQRKIDKALSGVGQAPSPAAGVVSDAVHLVEAIANGMYGGDKNARGPSDLPWQEPSTPFPVGRPLTPSGIDPRLPDTDRPMPRKMENPVGWNLPGQGNHMVPWTVLRSFADQVDAVRLCIGVRKKELASVEWSIAVKQELVTAIAQDEKLSSGRARAQAQQEYADEIKRLTAFWEKPDRLSRLTFSDWFGMLIEEQLVTDAVSIYPHPDLAGNLHSLELIDGSTIKPLMDHRGVPPQPPQPAYQQMLWGFPRGEFTLTDEGGGAAGRMTSDELIYRPRERRTWTLYGFSAVEQALIAGDLYLKRQEWLRAEYTDGAIPAGLMIPPEALKWTPEQVRLYERNINAELAGNTQQRMRWRLTPPGVTTEYPTAFAERYNNEFDEYLIKLLCAFFDVMPTAIGFTPKGGLGGSGHQEGEADSAYRKGNLPFLQWAADIFNDINQTVLGAPPELTFVFDMEANDNPKVTADVDKSDVTTAIRTLNDTRADRGLPLYDFPEADKPFVLTPTGPVFIEGLADHQDTMNAFGAVGAQAGLDALNDPAPDDDTKPPTVPPSPDDSKDQPAPTETSPTTPTADGRITKGAKEMTAFKGYTRRHTGKRTWRPFNFDTVDIETAEQLNKAGKIGDWQVIEELVKATHPKGKARTGPGYDSHKALVKEFTRRIGQALAAAIDVREYVEHGLSVNVGKTQAPDGRVEDGGFLRPLPEGAARPGDLPKASIIKAAIGPTPVDTGPLAKAMAELVQQAWGAGVMDAKHQLGEAVAWDTWEPSYFEAAAKIGGKGLANMLAAADIQVKSIVDTKMEQVANRLSYAIDQGWSVDKAAGDISSLLLDPDRATMIANTEINRAMSTATLEGYREAGVQKVDWLLSTEPCELCEENADAGPIDVSGDWPNGDPPVHPNCECSLAPSGDPADYGDTGTDEDGQPIEETEDAE